MQSSPHLCHLVCKLVTRSFRVFSSLLGQGVTCQWTASSALTFVTSESASAVASGVFFDGWSHGIWCMLPIFCVHIVFRHCVFTHARRRTDTVCAACALLPLAVHSTLRRYLGSSVRTCVVGAIPPSHCLELGSCSRSLNDGNQV